MIPGHVKTIGSKPGDQIHNFNFAMATVICMVSGRLTYPVIHQVRVFFYLTITLL